MIRLGEVQNLVIVKKVEFGVYVAEQLAFGSNMRGSADYRKQITPVLVKRAIMKAGKEQ